MMIFWLFASQKFITIQKDRIAAKECQRMDGRRFSKTIVVLITVWQLLSAAAGASTPEAPRPPAELFIVFENEQEPEYAVVVDKSKQRLHVFEYNGGFREMFQMPCSTGELSGRKTLAGDKKTPEGVYFFVKQHLQRDLAPIYGSRAFPIDYPNFMDRRAGRSGSAIWLHGTNKPLKPRDSNGCIVMRNRDIDRLSGYITLHRTPIIIVGELSEIRPGPSIAHRESVMKRLRLWKTALERGTYHDFLAPYHPDYLPDLSWWMEWNRIRRQLKGMDVDFRIELRKTAMFRYNDLITVIFDQFVTAADKDLFTGTRKLFVAIENRRLRIVGDTQQKLPEQFNPKVQENPLLAAGRELAVPPIDAKEQIARFVDDWLKAWSSKDIRRYGSCYASDFRSEGGADRAGWLRYKDQLNKRYRYIRVTKAKMVIDPGENRSRVSFVQTYRSNQFRAVGVKELILTREDDQWKIYREVWKKL
jgi:murein L,D-transpeptidase YafK